MYGISFLGDDTSLFYLWYCSCIVIVAGQMCVHLAAIGGHVDVLRHLMWFGANINARVSISAVLRFDAITGMRQYEFIVWSLHQLVNETAIHFLSCVLH